MKKLIVSVLLYLSAISISKAQEFTGRVICVYTGDILFISNPEMDDGILVELDSADTPQLNQEFGQEAFQLTRNLALNEKVRVKITQDRDELPPLAVITILPKGTLLNHTLVRSGAAWSFGDASCDPLLASYEKEARESKRGLWSRSNPVPPIVFLHEQAMKEDAGKLSPMTKRLLVKKYGPIQDGDWEMYENRYIEEQNSAKNYENNPTVTEAAIESKMRQYDQQARHMYREFVESKQPVYTDDYEDDNPNLFLSSFDGRNRTYSQNSRIVSLSLRKQSLLNRIGANYYGGGISTFDMLMLNSGIDDLGWELNNINRGIGNLDFSIRMGNLNNF